MAWFEGDMAGEKPADRPSISDELSIAGREFADAVKSGDGAKVAETYKALKLLCEEEQAAEGAMDSEAEY